MSESMSVPSKDALVQESATWAARATGLAVVDKTSYLNASHLLTSVKHFRSQIAAYWAPHIEAAMDTKRRAESARKALVDEQTRMEAPLVDAEGMLKRSLLAWDAKQEQERLVEERRLQAEARRQAEAITLAAAAAMELEATAAGDTAMLQEAHDILEQPMDTPVIVVAKTMPKVQGVSYRDNFKAADGIDVKTLAAAVAAGTAPVMFLSPNLTAINRFVHDDKGATPIPGVRVFNDRQIAARATA